MPLRMKPHRFCIETAASRERFARSRVSTANTVGLKVVRGKTYDHWIGHELPRFGKLTRARGYHGCAEAWISSAYAFGTAFAKGYSADIPELVQTYRYTFESLPDPILQLCGGGECFES